MRAVIARMDECQRQNLRLLTTRPGIDRICRQVCDCHGVSPGELCFRKSSAPRGQGALHGGVDRRPRDRLFRCRCGT
ncbi:MAG: hypothetical protein MZV70_73470, partial [Desulfobacterales bacterium]|nr:hypothetical protein [Desulfobacterales bacterium]